MQLPESEDLEISRLSSVYSDTTNSYKFYWFLAILDCLSQNGEAIISLNEIALKMISNVWYPLNYFKLSFGKQDGFKKIADFLTERIEIDNSINSPLLSKQINTKVTDKERAIIILKVRDLLRWVPFRFIRPYFSEETRGMPDYQINNKIVELANLNFNNSPHKVIYRFTGDCIELNPIWINYFQKHQTILRGFIQWNLLKFLQKNNPNVIGLSEKLDKPKMRDLKQANVFWKEYIKESEPIRCIYSGELISFNNLSLDHFIPWSYVVHDQLWNIIPTPKTINSKKNNWLPSTELYLDKFAKNQFEALKFHIKKENFKIVEDYNILFSMNSDNLSSLSLENFTIQLEKYILPQVQTARNIGFSYPFIYYI